MRYHGNGQSFLQSLLTQYRIHILFDPLITGNPKIILISKTIVKRNVIVVYTCSWKDHIGDTTKKLQKEQMPLIVYELLK